MMSAYIRPRVRLEEEEWSCKKISFKRKTCFNLHFRRKVGFKKNQTNKHKKEKVLKGFSKAFYSQYLPKNCRCCMYFIEFYWLDRGCTWLFKRGSRRFYRTKNLLATYGTRYYRFYFCNGCKHAFISKSGKNTFLVALFDKSGLIIQLIIVINVLVFSLLFYCSSVLTNTTQSNLDKLQAVYNLASNNYIFDLPFYLFYFYVLFQ